MSLLLREQQSDRGCDAVIRKLEKLKKKKIQKIQKTKPE